MSTDPHSARSTHTRISVTDRKCLDMVVIVTYSPALAKARCPEVWELLMYQSVATILEEQD